MVVPKMQLFMEERLSSDYPASIERYVWNLSPGERYTIGASNGFSSNDVPLLDENKKKINLPFILYGSQEEQFALYVPTKTEMDYYPSRCVLFENLFPIDFSRLVFVSGQKKPKNLFDLFSSSSPLIQDWRNQRKLRQGYPIELRSGDKLVHNFHGGSLVLGVTEKAN